MGKMTLEESEEWFDELIKDVGGVSGRGPRSQYEPTDIRDLIANKNQYGEWIPRSDADIEARKLSYEQKYAERAASGGDRDQGGYSTELVEDPDRVWTRGTPNIPAEKATLPTDQGLEGQAFEKWKTPDLLEPLSGDQETRIRQLYERFLGRSNPTQAEVNSHLSGYRPGWEDRLFKAFRNSTEYKNSAREKIINLYKKYRGEDGVPNETILRANYNNQSGIAGVENQLRRTPSEDYKKANPSKKFIEKTSPSGATGATSAQEEIPSSWNRPAPVMGDMFNEPPPPPPPDPDPVPDTIYDVNPPDTRPTAQPVPAPPKVPYSVRPITQPYSVNSGIGVSPTSRTPDTSTPPQGYPPGMSFSPSYQGTMGPILSTSTPAQASSGVDPSSWDSYDGYYGRAGQDFGSGPQGWGYNPAPWANTDRLLRGQFGRPGMAGTSTNPFTGDETDRSDESDVDRRARRAYEFGRQEALGNQYNTNIGNQDFRSQMDRWIQSYNQWNQQGVDPFAPPVGGRRAITGTGSFNNTGGS
jgi:hypothetical protein